MLGRFQFLSALGLLLSVSLTLVADSARGAEQTEIVKTRFFFLDMADYQWVDSIDEESLQSHFAMNESSFQLYTSLQETVNGPDLADTARPHFSTWLTEQRLLFQGGRSNAEAFRRSEGLVAYLRAHEFNVKDVVDAIKRRSGATEVQIIAIHHAGSAERESRFLLKVVLQNSQVELGQSGYIVRLQTPYISYVTMLYALGIALYELNELPEAARPVQPTEPVDEPPVPRAALKVR